MANIKAQTQRNYLPLPYVALLESPIQSTLLQLPGIRDASQQSLFGPEPETCPIQVLMEIASGRTLSGEELKVDPSVRARAAAELCSYIYPKRKAVEISGNDGAPIVFAVIPEESDSAQDSD